MRNEPGYRALVGRIRDKATTYLRKQIELPKQEITEIVKANLRAAVWFGIAIAFVWLALVSFVVFVVMLLAILLPLWLAALVSLLLFLAIAGICAYAGYKKLVLHGPDRTTRQVKETIRWVKTPLLGRNASS